MYSYSAASPARTYLASAAACVRNPPAVIAESTYDCVASPANAAASAACVT